MALSVNTYGQTKASVKAPVKSNSTVVNPLKNNKDSAGYALGIRILQNLQAQGLDAVNLVMLQKAMNDMLQKKPLLLKEDALDRCIGTFANEVNTVKLEKSKKASKDFLAANGKRQGVITLPSGLQYEILKDNPGGTKPTATDQVKCHYHGTLIDGTIFDSSVDRGEPIVFSVGGVIKGWQEALQLMTVGSKWKLYIPSDLAYGDQQAGPKIGPGSTLIFEVELLSIEK
ncbi:MAG: FKBP-type peptidyl-prolyl cis-trans isomerase [Chitinophagaceae bacterium]|nr:FKBP-type peptidyl-prolyl cis-trans isomerase [Chitinophagaceae bacterium]